MADGNTTQQPQAVIASPARGLLIQAPPKGTPLHPLCAEIIATQIPTGITIATPTLTITATATRRPSATTAEAIIPPVRQEEVLAQEGLPEVDILQEVAEVAADEKLKTETI